jgi:hypothetical protein
MSLRFDGQVGAGSCVHLILSSHQSPQSLQQRRAVGDSGETKGKAACGTLDFLKKFSLWQLARCGQRAGLSGYAVWQWRSQVLDDLACDKDILQVKMLARVQAFTSYQPDK